MKNSPHPAQHLLEYWRVSGRPSSVINSNEEEKPIDFICRGTFDSVQKHAQQVFIGGYLTSIECVTSELLRLLDVLPYVDIASRPTRKLEDPGWIQLQPQAYGKQKKKRNSSTVRRKTIQKW